MVVRRWWYLVRWKLKINDQCVQLFGNKYTEWGPLPSPKWRSIISQSEASFYTPTLAACRGYPNQNYSSELERVKIHERRRCTPVSNAPQYRSLVDVYFLAHFTTATEHQLIKLAFQIQNPITTSFPATPQRFVLTLNRYTSPTNSWDGGKP